MLEIIAGITLIIFSIATYLGDLSQELNKKIDKRSISDNRRHRLKLN